MSRTSRPLGAVSLAVLLLALAGSAPPARAEDEPWLDPDTAPTAPAEDDSSLDPDGAPSADPWLDPDTAPTAPAEDDSSLDPDGAPSAATEDDPWLDADTAPVGDDSWLDSLNRGSREFNFWMFDHVLEPASRGYNYVMPKWGQQRLQNFFENLERPRDIINSLLQGKGRRAGNHLAAFLVNTTAGLAGFFVLSDRFIDIEPPETGNETLGVYGIPPGPYLVVPLYGETCPRCLLGSLGDMVMYPTFWIPGQAGTYASIGARGLNAVNLVAKQMPSPFASDSEWQAYRERLHDRHAYEEAKRLFYENQALDVAD